MHESTFHTPVLLEEVLHYLLTAPDGVYVDATVGGGGHATAVLEKLGSRGLVIGIDTDSDAIAAAQRRLESFGQRAVLVQDNFRNLKAILAARWLQHVDGVLFDLGVSSFQLDEATKGFSFRSDERLDMRMDRRGRIDARVVVNEYSERTLAELFWKYGEEKHARRIAKRIVQARAQKSIDTTGELAGVVEAVVGHRFLTKSLARVFQAIRIEVNNELENLQQALNDAIDVVRSGGRIVVISYHSLEDRIVKQTMKRAAATTIPSGLKLVPDKPLQPRVAILTKKPITVSPSEITVNPRSRSAKLRAAEKL
ncbi:MAG TPA: 16S rRNA (cytosine(1402)-N(4))-methyltransferase RsmH [Bacteroidota bacterium]|nr:16S rRNA (cytosine(1402)-N(4))-methyltransferase RsmH [Bacteroidota bacterium]